MALPKREGTFFAEYSAEISRSIFHLTSVRGPAIPACRGVDT